MAGGKTIELQPVLNTAAAEALLVDLLAARGGPIQVRADQVRQIGGLCAQILIAAHRDWRDTGGDFRLVAPSAALIGGLARLGIGAAHVGAEAAQ